MRAALKFIVVTTGLLLIACTLGAFFLGGSFGGFAKSGMEDLLTRAFGAPTTVQGLSISPLDQNIELRGVSVENPEHFSEGSALTFDRVLVNYDWKTLLSKEPTIPKISVSGADVNVRHELGRGLNMNALQEAATKSLTALGLQQPGQTAEPSDEPLIRLEELEVTDSTMHVTSNILPEQNVEIPLEPFTVSNTTDGRAEQAGQVGAKFLQALMKQAASVDSLIQPVKDLFAPSEKPAEPVALEEQTPPEIP